MSGQQRVWQVLRRAVTLSVGGISLVTALSWLAGLHWIFELLSHFSFYFFLLGAALVLAALGLRLLRVAALSAAIALASGFVVWPHMNLPASDLRPREVPVVRVLWANLHNWATDLDAFYRLVDKERPDVVVLTELAATHGATLEALRPILPFQTPMPTGNALGMMMLAKKPPESLRFDLAAGERAPLLVARVCPEKTSCLTVVSLHASRPFPYREGARDRELANAAEVARRHVEAGEYVMLVGDLNVTPFSPVFARLLEKSGLLDSAVVPAEQARASTSTWWLGNTGIGLPIDHALVGAKIRIVNRRLGPSIGSDHLPLILDVRLPD